MIECSMSTPSASSTHVGHGCTVNETTRATPSGCSTSGANAWVASSTVPEVPRTAAATPLISMTRPSGGFAATCSRPW